MQNKFELTDEMIRDIEVKRNWVRNHYSPETIGNYDTIDGKLKLLDTILKSDWIDKSETLKLQSLGITLGDIFVQDMSFCWVGIEDEYGTDPAIELPETTIILFPSTMISKRIEADEVVNVYELYEGIKRRILEIKSES